MLTARGWVVRPTRIMTGVMVLCALAMPAASFADPAKEQETKDAKDAAKDAKSASTERAYAAGTRAFEAGKLSEAVTQLSAALSGGGLPNPQMAKALYYRGTAYRKQGKPAQAISDLTTAVWLKGGLSDADRAKATDERQLAYREAGLGDVAPPIGAAPLDAPAAKPVEQAQVPSAPKAPAAPRPGVMVATVPPQSSFFSMPSITMPTISLFGSGSSSSSTPASTPAPAVAEQPAAEPSSWQTATAPAQTPSATLVQGFAPDPAAAAPQAAPQVAPQAAMAPEPQTSESPMAGAGSAISGFFGNLFGSSGSSAQPAATATATPASPVATGSTGHSDGAWGASTVVATAQTSSMVQRGPDDEPNAALPWSATQTVAAAGPASIKATQGATAAGGKYKLQVAAVRTRAEAEKLASALNGYDGVRSGAVQSEIDEAVIGSMGTFYRVRLGPYRNADEPTQLCKTLRPQGFDCMVVTQ